MSENARRLTPSASTVVAVVLVLGAAAFAWFGLRPEADGPTKDAVIATTSSASRPMPAQSVAGVSHAGRPTRIVVPSAQIDALVQEVGVKLEGGRASWETAWRAAGHHFDSAMPGQPGNMNLKARVSVSDHGNVGKVLGVPPSAVRLLRSDSAATVTLVTCAKELKNRLVVVGNLAS